MFNIHKSIQTESELRKIIPPHSKILDKRIQPKLDFFSREFMAQACIAILATTNKHIPMFTINYQKSTKILSDKQIELNNLIRLQALTNSTEPCYATLFFMVPGLGHTLRINGSLEKNNDEHALFNITGVYFHCARAAARSGLWHYSDHSNKLKLTTDNILSHSAYVLLKTRNHAGQIELSPRGDKTGFIQIIDNETLFMPERPGNKVAVSLRNIIQNPNIELLVIVPGQSYTKNIHAHAYVTTDSELLTRCTVNEKAPKAGIVIKVTRESFQEDAALIESELWNATKAVDKNLLTAFPKALSSHMNGTGLMGKATNTIVGAIVKHDMKNLY